MNLSTSPARPLAVAAILVVLLSGCVLAVGAIVALPSGVEVAAAVVCGMGAVVFGVVTHHQARRTGEGFWRAIGKSVRTTLRAAWDLLF